jgi:hypothetical protein
MWSWTRARMAAILNVHPSCISADWTLRPDFHFGPFQRHAAIIWILAHLESYRMQASQRLSMKEYIYLAPQGKMEAEAAPLKVPTDLDTLG